MHELVKKHERPLSEQTAKELIKHIKNSGLKEGDQIPNETELCNKLGVSRSTVREAIKSLVSRNILTIRRGVGTFICDNIGITEDPFGLDFVTDKTQLLLDLMQFRQIIEVELVKMAAKNSTELEVSTLMELEEKLEKAYHSGKDTTSFDIQFHTQITKCSRNRVVELIFPILTKSIPAVNEYTKQTLMEDTISDHRLIIEAIKNKDPEKAEELMLRHLTRNTKSIESLKS